MSEYYHIVPWYSSEEWHDVYFKIYSNISEKKQEALNLLKVWKARCPSLPSGIESTFTLLEVHIQDEKCSGEIINDQLLRLAYSSAIMRYVNNMLDTETSRGASFYNAAKNLGVPDWVIDLRHNAAHSHNLPSLEILREACTIALDWLQKNYWEKHKIVIKDYISDQKEINITNVEESKIVALMNLYTFLSLSHFMKIKKLASLPNDMRESILNDTMDLFGDRIDLSNKKKVSINMLINTVSLHSKNLLKSTDTVSYVNRALLGKESFFLSLEVLNFLSKNEFHNDNKLNTDYVCCFEILLTFLHTNDLILDFIMELIKITQNDDNRNICVLAALWVSQILKALKKCRDFKIKMFEANFEGKSQEQLKTFFNHWYPSKKGCLLLDLQKPVPKELHNITFIQPIISMYNAYLTHFIKDLIDLVEPPLAKSVSRKICTLAKLLSTPEKFPFEPSKVYTVEDIKKAQDMAEDLSHEQNIETDSDCVDISDQLTEMEVDSNQQRSDFKLTESIWQLSSSEHEWSMCPIGMLPWQLQVKGADNLQLGV